MSKYEAIYNKAVDAGWISLDGTDDDVCLGAHLAGIAAVVAAAKEEAWDEEHEAGTEWGVEWSDSRPDDRDVIGGFDSYAAASYDLHESDLHGSIVSRECRYGPWVAIA